MDPKLKQLWQQANPLAAEVDEAALALFAEAIVRDCAEHILSSTDRYRKEYFAHKILDYYGVKL
jgi:UDP-3-O-acyl-N-acetylglucosamine deacetylase